MATISEDDFDNNYVSIPNPEDGSCYWEHAHLKGVPDNCVWSALDCDGAIYLVPGFHTVNHFGYVVSETPHNFEDIEVLWHEPSDLDLEEASTYEAEPECESTDEFSPAPATYSPSF